MPREYAAVRLDIWADEDFKTLSPAAQHLYFVLLTDPKLSKVGVTDWRPIRLVARARGWTLEDICEAAVELAERLYIVIDEATEEVLIRTFVKHDGVLKQPNAAVTMANDYAAVSSDPIRAVFIHELFKLNGLRPEYKGWSKERVQALLHRPQIDPRKYPTGFPHRRTDLAVVDDQAAARSADPVSTAAEAVPNPSVKPSRIPSDNPSAKASGNPSVKGYVPEPEPKPSTSDDVEGRKSRPRSALLPENWMPPETAIAAMRTECPTVDLESEHRKFVDHWRSKAERRADWTAAWRNWIRRAAESGHRTTAVARPVMPNGRQLTPAELKFAQAEALKTNPNPDILRAAGLPVPARVDTSRGLSSFGPSPAIPA
ncbi:hypothetical protein [Nocardia terpenica]|uniref:Uncharacterized protein n=1 Tax=Nocardia terpenica TaxID=455432 RepID=A0A161Z6V7_9NOCA|nr:hypothetical protein [Nocardia terpenica]KZM75784.1 hypothetical protein AWN90_20830 [Nocardia terpenica]NQE86303.1 hypothetical protein [Nocardia terpenica]